MYSAKTYAAHINMGTILREIVGKDNHDLPIGSNKLMALMRTRIYIDYMTVKSELNEQQVIPAFL